jgi:endonuclease YncB( thermonuclease family)
MLRICSLLVLVVLAQPVVAQTLVGTARVIDGDTLVLAGERIRLYGIDAPETGQTCRDTAGAAWDCGGFATGALAALAAAEMRCEGVERDRYDRLVARCRAAGADVGAALVEAGAAFAYARYAADYLPHEARARAAGRGVWSGQAERPEVVRAFGGAAGAPEGCAIKGNISGNGRLYHLPGSRGYAATTISTAKGERWFCSEDQAVAAGWVKARG